MCTSVVFIAGTLGSYRRELVISNFGTSASLVEALLDRLVSDWTPERSRSTERISRRSSGSIRQTAVNGACHNVSIPAARRQLGVLIAIDGFGLEHAYGAAESLASGERDEHGSRYASDSVGSGHMSRSYVFAIACTRYPAEIEN